MNQDSKGHIVISMDTHTDAVVDLKPFLPKKLHGQFEIASKAGYKVMEDHLAFVEDYFKVGGAQATYEMPEMTRSVTASEYNPQLTPAQRIAAQDEDGISAEFIVQTMGAESDDPLFQHEVTLAYNRWFEDYASIAPHRFTGTTVVNLQCGIDVVLAEIQDAYQHGLQAISLAGNVQTMVSKDLPQYNHRMYEPVWDALNERRMAAVFHCSSGRETPLQFRYDGTERGWEALMFHEITYGVRDAMRFILLSGVLERYPNLHVGYIEAGTSWIPPLLKVLDTYFHCRMADARNKLEMSPSEQWQRQGFSGGTLSAEELANRHAVGVGTLMWGSDFPHVEGTYPNSRQHLATLFSGLPDDEVDAMLYKNAARVFNFDLATLAKTPAANKPWPAPMVKAA